MPAGMRTFNTDGSPALSIDDRVFRLLTVINVGSTASGTVGVPGLADGTPVVQTAQGGSGRTPTITVAGGNVSWNYGSIPSGERDTSLNLVVAVF